MIKIKSKNGTQIVTVRKTGAGVRIAATEVKTQRTDALHVFDECIHELISALQECEQEYAKHTGK